MNSILSAAVAGTIRNIENVSSPVEVLVALKNCANVIKEFYPTTTFKMNSFEYGDDFAEIVIKSDFFCWSGRQLVLCEELA